MNTISIGIPVYNQVNTIADAIEAALAQTTSAMEIVVSENHSTDGTAEVVARYKDRIRICTPPYIVLWLQIGIFVFHHARSIG